MGNIRVEGKKLIYQRKDELTIIEPYGMNCLRCRSTKNSKILDENWTVLPPATADDCHIECDMTRAGYQCTWAPDGQTAADLMEREKFDLALLDIMLPGINGYELMDYAKACELPVIFLTALGSTEHKVKGLRMGADDYLPKPFEIVELLARVEAVLRRYHKTETMIQVNNVTIDTASHRVTLDGEEIYLTPKEFDLLLLFARNKNRALYRETIYETVWGGEYMGQSRTVDLHVQRLKKKLHWEEMIVAVYKVGYRLNEVRS